MMTVSLIPKSQKKKKPQHKKNYRSIHKKVLANLQYPCWMKTSSLYSNLYCLRFSKLQKEKSLPQHSHLQSALPAVCTVAIVPQNLWEWQPNVWFHLRLTTREGGQTLYSLRVELNRTGKKKRLNDAYWCPAILTDQCLVQSSSEKLLSAADESWCRDHKQIFSREGV